MWDEARMCAPVACWRRFTAATEGLVGGYEMSKTHSVMHLLWRVHRFGH